MTGQKNVLGVRAGRARTRLPGWKTHNTWYTSYQPTQCGVPINSRLAERLRNKLRLSAATVLLFNKIWDISRTAWEVEFGPRKLAGQCS